MKQFVKAMDKEGDCFDYIFKSFLRDQKCCDSMIEVELAAWSSFVEIVQNFLENYRADNYKVIVNNIPEYFRIRGINMSIKGHFLYSHQD